MGTYVKVISWNVRRLNCPVKRGDVKWVLHKFACDVAILQESKMEEVGCEVVVSLWGRRRVEWRFLPSEGRSGGIIIMWDPQVFELEESRIGGFSVCCRFKSQHDSFVWGSDWSLWS